VRTELPKTATSLPLVGLIGLLSLAGGLTLHLFSRRRLGRG
jgi:LPXTG-motif cell wall-anchored protein